MFNVLPTNVAAPLVPVVVKVKAPWYCGIFKVFDEKVAAPEVPVVVNVIVPCAPISLNTSLPVLKVTTFNALKTKNLSVSSEALVTLVKVRLLEKVLTPLIVWVVVKVT